MLISRYLLGIGCFVYQYTRCMGESRSAMMRTIAYYYNVPLNIILNAN